MREPAGINVGVSDSRRASSRRAPWTLSFWLRSWLSLLLVVIRAIKLRTSVVDDMLARILCLLGNRGLAWWLDGMQSQVKRREGGRFMVMVGILSLYRSHLCA